MNSKILVISTVLIIVVVAGFTGENTESLNTNQESKIIQSIYENMFKTTMEPTTKPKIQALKNDDTSGFCPYVVYGDTIDDEGVGGVRFVDLNTPEREWSGYTKVEDFVKKIYPRKTVYLDAYDAKRYNNGEISFDYPETWYEVSEGRESEFISFSDQDASFNVTINKHLIPSSYKLKEHFNKTTSINAYSSFQTISKKIMKVNGVTAYKSIYKIHMEGISLQQRSVCFEKDGTLYNIVYTSSIDDFEKVDGFDRVIKGFNMTYGILSASIDDFEKSSSFNKVINSFNIKNSDTTISYEKYYWGKLLIPKINLECRMRSDTVNAYDSVYHYPESVYPGENGECGLMGHRTMYSAPFGKIDQLETGDLVIINDFLTSKKYIYKVVSNGNDIRWDYKENPIKFEQGGEPRLILVTCHLLQILLV